MLRASRTFNSLLDKIRSTIKQILALMAVLVTSKNEETLTKLSHLSVYSSSQLEVTRVFFDGQRPYSFNRVLVFTRDRVHPER